MGRPRKYFNEEDETYKSKKTSNSRKVANFIIKFYEAAMNPKIRISHIKGGGTTAINLSRYCYDSKFHNIAEIMGRINTVINLSSNKDRQTLVNLKKKTK